MFFTLSKVLWWVTEPANALMLLLGLGVGLLWTRWRRLGRILVTATAVLVLLIAVLPIGAASLALLEDRFPVIDEPPAKVDGIIVLGGVVDPYITAGWGQISIDGEAERITEFVNLAGRFPEARLVFAGGSGRLLRQGLKEADTALELIVQLGIETDRVEIESQSRNTHENAVYAKDMINPAPGESWILITSAFHMSRSVGCFRQAGWPVIPYPVDFKLEKGEGLRLSFSLGDGLDMLGTALHEWLGLTFYWLTGRTDVWWPGPVPSRTAS